MEQYVLITGQHDTRNPARCLSSPPTLSWHSCVSAGRKPARTEINYRSIERDVKIDYTAADVGGPAPSRASP